MIIENLFPTAVSFFDLGRDFSAEELAFVSNQKMMRNSGNAQSVNTKLLESVELQEVRSFIDNAVKQYYQEVYSPKSNVELYVTQSWSNITKPGEYHHKHRHPNSFISGVIYFHADKEKDNIHFFRQDVSQLRANPVKYNAYNSESWFFPVGTGQLVLFPSSLEHMVVTTESKDSRISLAFNTFLRGELGVEEELTLLKLEK